MKKRLPQLGKLGTAFFSLAHIRHLEVVRLGDLQNPLSLSASQEQQLLKRLTLNGFILRITRGTFLVPDKIPPGGYWQPSGNYLVAKLMQLYEAKYYIGGMSAMHFHGLTTQIPNEITIYNDKINAKKSIGVQRLFLIKTQFDRLDGTSIIKLKNNNEIVMASLAHTILDTVHDWKRLGTLPEAYDWIKQRSTNKEFVNDLVQLTSKYANIITIRRIGYCLELFGINPDVLKPLLKKLTATKGWAALDPNQPARGKTDKRWRIINNVEKL